MKPDNFHRRLERLVNMKPRTVPALVRFMLNRSALFKEYARYVCDSPPPSPTGQGQLNAYRIDPYDGNNPFVLRMIRHLGPVSEFLAHAVVHGSLATNEEIDYSDFDAIAVIRKEAFGQPDILAGIADRLSSARRIMLEYDPLQHHGWFVIGEFELDNFDEGYFPSVLFKSAKSLTGNGSTDLRVTSHSNPDHKRQFIRYSQSLLDTLANHRRAGNLYELKNIYSRFMLMPSMYCAARDGNPIDKKNSFESARTDFSSSDWNIMDEISGIRSEWMARETIQNRNLLPRMYFLPSRLLAPFYPSVPEPMGSRYRRELSGEMVIFVRRMMDQLK